MKRVLSKQRNVRFVYSPSPIVIDKREAWGPSESNFQQHPQGGFLKVNDDNYTISHGVQPNSDNTAPVGWLRNTTVTSSATFDKLPIWVDDSRVIKEGEVLKLETLDGPIEYTAKSDSFVVYNGDTEPNTLDVWCMTRKDLEKNYEFTLEEATV